MRRKYSISGLKKAYRAFIELKYPTLSKRGASTKVDDAFYIFRAFKDEDPWYFILEPTRDAQLKEELTVRLQLAERKNPKRDAGGYVRAMREFRGFLDLIGTIEAAELRIPRKIEVE